MTAYQVQAPARILVIEDDQDIAELERDYLEASGYVVTLAADGPKGLALGLSGGFDLAILDVMLPGMDGLSVCRQLRERTSMPVVMVTARGEDVDVIRGLGVGADDYVTKPFSPSVLVARVRARLAEVQRLRGEERAAGQGPLRMGHVALNPASHEVSAHGRPVTLTNREYELLAFLMRHPNVVFSRQALYERVWREDAVGDGATVTVHVNRLREKLEDDPSHPELLQTVRGAGYVLRAPERG
ncbi:MAG: response regulator transcription factor [Olsenella sp.]|jgi:DNA-binding response OmpR family regulator|nr:response regulator transcription factor [Olsenella sp.]MCI1289777.1 response regulator transcription factor [Olsenella sp.]